VGSWEERIKVAISAMSFLARVLPPALLSYAIARENINLN